MSTMIIVESDVQEKRSEVQGGSQDGESYVQESSRHTATIRRPAAISPYPNAATGQACSCFTPGGG